ncbi:MAG: diguanylate cyclase [Deltaproteobacteria bacterium]|nr:diguanylate cyclase [Deltaproteobacteria bacterium]
MFYNHGRSFKAHDARVVLVGIRDKGERSNIERALDANGYAIRYAASSASALKIIKSWRPGAVLIDIGLVNPSGCLLCRDIKRIRLSGRPSVILLSDKRHKNLIKDIIPETADDFVFRPVDKMDLIARIKTRQRFKEVYREIEDDKRNLEKILDITTAVSATLNSDEVFDTIVKKVTDVTEAIRCSILLITSEDTAYVLETREKGIDKNLKLDLRKYPEIQKVIKTKIPLVVDNMATHPLMSAIKDSVKGFENMSALVVPIVFNDEVLGTLFLRARRDGGFTSKEISFCKIVANASYFAIKNANLYDEVRTEREHLKKVTTMDQLTGLYNHNYFYTRLDEEMSRAFRYSVPLSLMMLDIDDFKMINDTYGHRVGDTVLKGLSMILKDCVRKTDVVARYGGEEFAILLPHTSLDGAVGEAERIRQFVEGHSFSGIGRNITISIGVASFVKGEVASSGELVNRADRELYAAKKAGKNCVRVAIPK